MTNRELYVELRDMKQRIAVMLGELAEDLAREDRMFEGIMAAVKRNPLAVPCASTREPPLAPHICYEACDEPDA